MSYCQFKQLDEKNYICEVCNKSWIDKAGFGHPPSRWCGNMPINEEEMKNIRASIERRNEEQVKRTEKSLNDETPKFPSLVRRAKSYLEEHSIWVAANKPMRSNNRIIEIYNTYCKECPHYLSTGYACDLCGCYINTGTLINKLAWSTTRCPDIPPKWVEEDPYRPLIEYTNIEIPKVIPKENMPPPIPTNIPDNIPNPPVGGCGCSG